MKHAIVIQHEAEAIPLKNTVLVRTRNIALALLNDTEAFAGVLENMGCHACPPVLARMVAEELKSSHPAAQAQIIRFFISLLAEMGNAGYTDPRNQEEVDICKEVAALASWRL